MDGSEWGAGSPCAWSGEGDRATQDFVLDPYWEGVSGRNAVSRGGPCVHRVPLAACGDRPWGQDRSRESREEEVMMDRTRVGTVMGLGEIALE